MTNGHREPCFVLWIQVSRSLLLARLSLCTSAHPCTSAFSQRVVRGRGRGVENGGCPRGTASASPKKSEGRSRDSSECGAACTACSAQARLIRFWLSPRRSARSAQGSRRVASSRRSCPRPHPQTGKSHGGRPRSRCEARKRTGRPVLRRWTKRRNDVGVTRKTALEAWVDE